MQNFTTRPQPYTLEWITDLNARPKAPKLLEEDKGNTATHRQNQFFFLYKITKTQGIRSNADNQDYVKLSNFSTESNKMSKLLIGRKYSPKLRIL